VTILRVDLTTRSSSVTPVSEGLARRVPGLFGLRLLLEETPPGLPVFDPAQSIVFGAGATSGRRALALAQCSVVAKSPLSGGIGESRVQGPFGPALADTGHEAVVLTGRATRPSYLLITPAEARVLDAADLWGMDTDEVTAALTARHGPETHVAAIGPAGENLVRFAGVVTDFGFTAARMGMGAVLGAKNCKAIAVLGGASPVVADAVRRVTHDYVSRMDTNPLTRSEHAVPGFGTWPAEGLEGYLGARNYGTSGVSLAGFTPEAFTARLTRSSGGCPGCPQDCLKSFGGSESGVLHQEAVAAFAANLGIEDLDTVLELNEWCNRAGVDPVSVAGVLAFRCDLAQAGVLDGPRFGDTDALRGLLPDIVHRIGEGDLLAEGVARAAKELGPETEPYALHSKGVEIPGFDPRGCQGLGLAYAVHPLGPRYDGVEHDIDFDPVDGEELFILQAQANGCPEEGLPMDSLTKSKVDLVANLMELWSGYDAAGICLYAAPPTRNLTEDSAADLLSAVAGSPITPDEIHGWGRTRLALMRQYNLREGFTSADDILPAHFFTHPVDGGRLAGAVLDHEIFDAATRRLRILLHWPS
jgi:aldehyde:ferredoxin oxidoreductase